MMHDVANQALDFALKYTDQAEIYVEKEEGVNVDIKKDKVDFAKGSIHIWSWSQGNS